ncbi:hypothetical protein NMG60_11031496 [Bertholletia excelsa]
MESPGPWLGGGRRWGDPWSSPPFASDIWDPSDWWRGGRNPGDDTPLWPMQTSTGARRTRLTYSALIFLEEVEGKWHRVERRRGSFTRRFRLPENANLDEVKCGLENGVLTVTVPKKETQTHRNVRFIDVA